MPVTAAIKFTQGFTTDLAGRALIGTTGVSVGMTNGDNTDVFDWTWELLTKPSASAIPIGVIAAGAVISASFLPDVRGSYLARLTVKDTLGNQAQDIRAFIVPEVSGRYIPPFRGDASSLNYGGQTEGWDPSMEAWLQAVEAGGGPTAAVAPVDIVFAGALFSTDLTTFDRAGARMIDMAPFPPVIGLLARSVKFIVDVQKPAGPTSVEVQLFDVTHGAQVSALLYAASTALTELTSTALTVGAAAGNIRNDVSTMYEVSIRRNGGAPTDEVFVTNARVQITYA